MQISLFSLSVGERTTIEHLERMRARLTRLEKAILRMNDNLQALKDAQARHDAASENALAAMQLAIQKIKDLASQIASAGTDADALAAITDDLKTHAANMEVVTGELTDAVSAQKQAVATVVDAQPAAADVTGRTPADVGASDPAGGPQPVAKDPI